MRTIPARNWCLSSALVVTLLGVSLAQAQVSKWVDEKGTVHYGDIVPDQYRGSAKAMPLRRDAPRPVQEKEAQLPLQKDRESLKTASRTSEPIAPAIIDSPTLQQQTNNLSCDEQWKQYFDAQDCFGPYRNANGSTKVEALSHCPVVNEPTGCSDRRTSVRTR